MDEIDESIFFMNNYSLYLRMCIFCSTFAPWTCAGDVCTSAAKGSRHNKGVKYALFLAIWNLVNSIVSKTLQHLDVLGICISISVHLIRAGVRVRTYRRGLRCCLFGYKGNTRASDSGTATVQSRFFLCLLLSMSNFLLDVQGILRTSRYGEELLIYMVWRK